MLDQAQTEMPAAGTAAGADGLVEAAGVRGRIYTDPAIFEEELRRIWGGTWIYVGHESQVPEPGDWYATRIGRVPVIMIRGDDGAIRVLHNRCPHKGAMVVPEGSGHAKVLRCGYHGWCFGRDGRNRSIPLPEGYAGTCIGEDARLRDLEPVARCDSYRGFVFASLTDAVPPLAEWLGGARASIDNMVARAPEGALEVTGGVLRYVHNSNWKFFVENLNDMLHPMVAHRSSSRTARIVAKQELDGGREVPAAIEILGPFTNTYRFFDEMGVHAFAYGHSYSGGRVSIHSGYREIPEYVAALEKACGAERTREILSMQRHNTVIYPSLTVKGPIQTIRVVRPLAVDRTLIESWTLRLKGAPEALLERSILYCNLINSHAGIVGPDDEECYWRQHQALAGSPGARVTMDRYPDAARRNDEGGWSAIGSSDMVFRNQYAAWRYYMTGGFAAHGPMREAAR
ncbi:MAG: oxidoreductase [Rhodothalassiaceae bacterium]|nr:MAG: oxidoreductase [Rhodothalassiaceae bacterium]